MAKVSVIVPVYNVEKYLRRCLDSILAQTYENLEILLLDDGSSDNSYEIMSEYAQKDSRIKIFKCEHKGIATVRKNGIEWATGDYVGFVDSDDWIEPDMYSSLYNIMVDNDCDLVSSDVSVHGVDGNEWIDYDNYKAGLYTDLERDIFPTLIHDFSVGMKGMRCYLVSKLFRTSKLKKVIEKIDPRVFYCEDEMILYRYCLECQSIYIMREYFYHYVKRTGSAELKPNENEPENMYRLFSNLKEAFEASPYRNVLMPQLYQNAVYLNNRILRGLYDIDLGQKSSWYFSEIEKLYRHRIVIYGAGACGQALYKELWLHGHGDDIVALVDKNYDKAKKSDGKTASEFLDSLKYEVKPVSFVNDIDYDHLVVAIYNESTAKEAIKELKEIWNIPEEKIIWMNSCKRDIASILSLAYL
ncbi:Glycosyltransferase involved in cell wall bisynthesis [Anaerovibrio lipolyticus DSM 3074]|uniref:Glycosyltransferase involved in cell wall bisynthesis n=1 Tax=Anaerovibrio lipolyticus DSM 3074 TaxID=1120997 RepID=A0A1M6AMN8_9FIRM|nr:glycosyltransferase [Anaerovibrio lipolyticus]SHI37732.1 Glycosyltransferase involved in cell wall bisynthesis [Anaerovibrio lipolyticus DSM 3074]